VISRLKQSPIFLAQRGTVTAALVSIEQWETLVKWIQQLEMLVEARRIEAMMDADPSQVILHLELKQRLGEKKANVGT
jgi:hypothetical protein